MRRFAIWRESNETECRRPSRRFVNSCGLVGIDPVPPSLASVHDGGWNGHLDERAELRAAGMLAGHGLVLGRTFRGGLIRLPHYCHVLLCGGTGSGKGVSIVIPNLLTYRRGSVVCFDTKGDLHAMYATRRAAMGQRIIWLAPFNGGRDGFNPLDVVPRDSPTLVDSARAIAEALCRAWEPNLISIGTTNPCR